jgi:hypothetical protein
MVSYKSSPISNIAKAICESLLAVEKAPVARKKIETGLLHVLKITARFFLPKRIRLQHIRRPQQGYGISPKAQERNVCRTKAPAACKKTSTGLLHIAKNPGTHLLLKNKTLATRKSTSPGYH